MKKNFIKNIIFHENQKKTNNIHSYEYQTDTNNHFLKLYEQILENSRDILYCLDFDSLCIEYVSPSVFSVIGKTREEIMSMPAENLVNFIHPSDKNIFLEHFKNFEKQNTNKSETLVYRLRPPKGIYRWISDNHTIIYDLNTNSKKIVGNLHDITDQKLTEDALKRSRDRLFMAIEATNDGMWDWRLDTNEVYFDQRFYTMLGYEPNEFKGSLFEWMKRIHPDDIKNVKHQMEKHLQGNSAQWAIEYRYKSKDNNWIWILNRGKVFEYNDNDKPLRIVGTHSDITIRKKAEISLKNKNHELLNSEQNLTSANEELRQRNDELQKIYNQLQSSEERFRQLAENTQDIFWLAEDGAILYINPVFDKIIGRSRKTLIKNPSVIKEWLYPIDREKQITWMNMDSFHIQNPFDEKFRIIKPSGEISWLWSRVFPIYSDEGLTHRIAGIISDITDQMQTENELITAKEKALESDRLKSAFLANISHEIRTPMNGIIGFASLLKERVLTDEKRDQYIDIITQSSKSLLHIIEDLVDISKLEANQIQINNTRVNLKNLLTQLYDHFVVEKQLYGKDHISLSFEIDKDNPDMVIFTDETRIYQILSNLISNAFKFTDKGEIKFGFSKIEGDIIELFVSDTGIGISNEVKPHIFKRFRQQETSHSRRFGGTGLGLSICDGLIQLMNGSIRFESVKSKGTQFYIKIPFSEDFETPVINNEAYDLTDTYRWPNKTILVVEDDPVNLEYFKTILSTTDVKMVFSITGEDAISICMTETKIDLILLDIRLPHMSGYEAFKKIKLIKPNIPIIAQTAFAMAEDAIECIEMGFSDYISKPVNRKKLFTKIDHFFSTM
jgi:PAS domain S-box-containing protein